MTVNTLTANGKYSLCNTDSLRQQNQMQLSKQTFSEFLASPLKSTS